MPDAAAADDVEADAALCDECLTTPLLSHTAPTRHAVRFLKRKQQVRDNDSTGHAHIVAVVLKVEIVALEQRLFSLWISIDAKHKRFELQSSCVLSATRKKFACGHRDGIHGD